MVNLSGCIPGKTLLDPFCGVGTILQEALLSRAQVIGVDANSWCVEATNENLEWLSREYALRDGEFRVLKGDALRLRSIVGSNIDCIVTEPDLGPALKDVPTSPYAQKIIDKLTPLYSGFLEQAHEVLREGGRLVLVTPCLRTRAGKPITMRTENMAQDIGFAMIYPFGKKEVFESYDYVKEDMRIMRRFVDMTERHKTGREIHVFQK
jgi:tRNA G10  N-methylase Trm11